MLLNAQESQYRRGGEFSVPDGIRSGAAAQWLEASSRSARENLMKSGGMMEYRLLANDTGGKYFDNTNSPEKVAEEIQRITGSYYVLGYPINEKWEVAEHEELLEIYPFDTSQYSPVVGPLQKNTPHILILLRCSVFNIPGAEVKLSAWLVHQPTRKKVLPDITFGTKLADKRGNSVVFPMELKTGHRSTGNTSFEIE